MYCKKCGKFIGNDSDLCNECRMREENAFGEFSTKTNPDPTPVYYQGSSYYGSNQVSLGKAIAAIVLSEIGFIFIYIGLILMAEMLSYGLYELESSIALMVIGCIPSLIGLVFGIQAIRHFKATSMIRSGKRVPLLILGIVSVVTAACSLLLAVIMLGLYGMI